MAHNSGGKDSTGPASETEEKDAPVGERGLQPAGEEEANLSVSPYLGRPLRTLEEALSDKRNGRRPRKDGEVPGA